jgi:hypothetical protein
VAPQFFALRFFDCLSLNVSLRSHPRRPSSSANAAEQHSLDSGWRRSCTASGPQPHSSLGSTGQRPTPPHYSHDLVHGPGVGPGLSPQLLPPTCSRRVCSVGMGSFCCVASLPRCPGPCWSPVFRSAICDCLSLKTDISFLAALCIPAPAGLQLFALRFVTGYFLPLLRGVFATVSRPLLACCFFVLRFVNVCQQKNSRSFKHFNFQFFPFIFPVSRVRIKCMHRKIRVQNQPTESDRSQKYAPLYFQMTVQE